jgi:signal transduction histidine kinase
MLLALALPAQVVGAWLARRDARPLSGPLAEVAKVARSFSNEDFSARVHPLGGSAETVAVGAVLNELGQRLEQTLGELRASRNELQHMLDLQRQLLTDISHELRTPLAAIMLHTELARDSNDTHELRVIAQEVENMKRLVQDIFDLVRLETGHLKLDWQPTDVDAVVERVVSTAVAAAGKRGVRLKKNSGSHPGLVALADAQRLEQVLHNLVNNAVRHTMADGSVELNARAEGELVVIEVADTGEGIALDELPYVFERFWRGDHARTQQDALRSSGLGLAIVKELVEAMGGTVAMHSRLGVGTTVEVRMRLLEQPRN